MRKILVIAKREYLATVKTKAFLVGILVAPLFMGGGLMASLVFKSLDDQNAKKFAIVDRTPGRSLTPVLMTAVERRNREDVFNKQTGAREAPAFELEIVEPSAEDVAAKRQQRFDLSERVRKSEIVGFLEIGPKAASNKMTVSNFLTSAARKLVSPDPNKPETAGKPGEEPPPDEIRFQGRATANGAMQFYRLALMELTLATKIDVSTLTEAQRKEFFNARPAVTMLGLTTKNKTTGEFVDDTGNKKQFIALFAGLGAFLLMLLLMMVGAMPLMQSVLEEKMQKIAEVLLGSATPFELMAGKLLGAVAVTLTLATIYLGATLWALHHFEFSQYVEPTVLLWMLLFLVPGMLMYGSLCLGIGAACNDMKDPQTLMTPVMLPLMAPAILIGPVINEPDGIIARLITWFPPTTPMMMVIRIALQARLAWWEPFLAIALVLLFTAGCVWVGGRIFRIGFLMQGKAPTLGQLIGWVFKS
jgi:ABC-2 type transport system permease protein